MNSRQSFRLDILRYLAEERSGGLGARIRAYVRELDSYLGQLRAAEAAANGPRIRRLAHRLASHFSALGHAGLLARAQRIEAAAVRRAFAAVRAELAALTVGVREFKRRLSTAAAQARRE